MKIRMRLNFLDQLRALAILPVVYTHYDNPSLKGGALGVYIFFTLSGFLIAMNLEGFKEFRLRDLLSFYIKRVFRIVPVFWLAVIIAAILLDQNGKTIPRDELIGILFFYKLPSEWYGFTIGVLWTLHIEFWFYILLGAFYYVGRKLGFGFTAPWLVLGFGYLIKVYPKLNPIAPSLSEISIYGIYLCTGSFFYFMNKRFKPQLGIKAFSTCQALFLGFLLTLFTQIEVHVNPYWLLYAFAVSFTSGIMVVLSLESTYFKSRSFELIGVISYSMYLVHPILIDFARPKILAYFAIVLVVSYASYIWIEKNGIKIGHRIADYVRTRASS